MPVGVSGRALLDTTQREPAFDRYVLKPEANDLDHFGGDTGDFTINTDQPTFGNEHSVKYHGSFADEYIGSTGGLTHYPQVGTRHEFWISIDINYPSSRDSGEAWPRVFFSSSSTSSWSDKGYRIEFIQSSQSIRLTEVGVKTIDSVSCDFQPDEPIRVQLLHEYNGDLHATVFDADGNEMATLFGNGNAYITDGEYDYPGIGFHSYRQTRDVIGNWRIE